jgi:hypothetical protein
MLELHLHPPIRLHSVTLNILYILLRKPSPVAMCIQTALSVVSNQLPVIH